jgi:hypothetical protein
MASNFLETWGLLSVFYSTLISTIFRDWYTLSRSTARSSPIHIFTRDRRNHPNIALRKFIVLDEL